MYPHLKQPTISSCCFPTVSGINQKKAARISANTAVHSHAIAAWWCLRGVGIEENMELLEDAGYLAFWV